jgi:imidazolonepropionase
MQADLLIHDASQLLTVASPHGPKRGPAMNDLGLISDGAVAIRDGRVLAVGPSDMLRSQIRAERSLSAAGSLVLPGFVDPHTHLVWAGERGAEFEMRVTGASYLQIMAAGGGIMNTVRQTRDADLEMLAHQSRRRLERMVAHGTTTIEIKTGYGLTVKHELKQLEAIHRLQAESPANLVATFLGAHAIPTEYDGRDEEYMDLVVGDMLPAMAGLEVPPRFCDVFCEEGAFSLAQSRRVLEKARALGWPWSWVLPPLTTWSAPRRKRSSYWHSRTPSPWPCPAPLLGWAKMSTLRPGLSSPLAGRSPWRPIVTPVPVGARTCSSWSPLPAAIWP